MSTALTPYNERFRTKVEHSQSASLIQMDKENADGRIIAITRKNCVPQDDKQPYEVDQVTVEFTPNSKTSNLANKVFVRTPTAGYWKEGDLVQLSCDNGRLNLKNLNKPGIYPYMHSVSTADNTPIFI